MRKLTLAATQFACGGDSARNLDKAEALVRRAAAEGRRGRPAAGAVRDALFLQGPAGRASSPWPAPRPAIRSSRASRLWRASWAIVLPVSFFERANNAHYNSVMRDRRRWERARDLPQVAYPRRGGLSGEVLFQPRGHRVSRLVHRPWPHRGRHLLGPVVSRMRPQHGAARARRSCSIPRPSAPSRWIPPSTAASIGAG